MRETLALLAGTLAAAAMPAALFAGLLVSLEAFVLAFAFALAHALVLGLPVAVVLRSAGRLRVSTLLLAGAAVGALPATLFFFPEGSEVWSAFLQLVGAAAGLGGAGGLAFYWAYRSISIMPLHRTAPGSRHDHWLVDRVGSPGTELEFAL